jgi:hypothetical protein
MIGINNILFYNYVAKYSSQNVCHLSCRARKLSIYASVRVSNTYSESTGVACC